VPVDKNIAEKYIVSRPWVDLCFVGPSEINFSNWIKNGSLNGSFSISHFLVGDIRTYQVKSIPTPYTDGIFDEILRTENKIKASFETNRGCPYACAFCDWGGQAQSKITMFEKDLVFAQIEKIYSHKNVHEIEILDANFGIVKSDIDIIDHMIAMQQKYNNKIYVSYSGLAKNGSKWLPVILDKIFSKLPIRQRNLKLSFQTHDKNTLNIIQRNNIDNTKLYPLIDSFKKAGIPTTSEMIIALPGETADSWLYTLEQNSKLGIDYIRSYFLNLVPNTPMYVDEYKTKHGIKTKRIRFPYEFSKMGYDTLLNNPDFSQPILDDYEEIEIIHACNSFDLPELLRMFDYHWFYHNLINSNGFRNIISNISNDAKIFLSRLHRMPILEKLVNRNRNVIIKLFNDEPVTEIPDLATYMYFSRCMRLDDVYQIWLNQNEILSELSCIYSSSSLKEEASKWKNTFSMELFGTDANLRGDR
jgi:DNA repair photolyase